MIDLNELIKLLPKHEGYAEYSVYAEDELWVALLSGGYERIAFLFHADHVSIHHYGSAQCVIKYANPDLVFKIGQYIDKAVEKNVYQYH